ncbi:AI-2E family transporter [Secundilactobacillus collinoides]|uniref:Permease n=2 Tax=Secundilactobacillus collinoides TaxID=33960 RepID=A0A0R2BGA6_SECCO|nr:AI-2E family transporter [Secundilactobacillus collinoides]KRM74627.1 permease [Secundilactobacillus collinoides DSM 20515 = JCM 1123]KZL41458.1 membrane protein [Secundilactobacillus collinoides]
MFDQIHRSKLLFWSLEILIVATLIWVCTKIDFLFSPIATFFNTIFMPILLAGVLFYLLNPVVKLIQKIKIGKYHISRTWAVALIFLIFFAVLAGGIVWLIPRLIQQVSTLVNNVPNIIKIIQNGLTDINDKLSSYKWLQNVDFSKYGAQIEKNLASYAQKFMNGLTSSVGTVVGMITSVTVVAVTVPVMLFYMLKDGHKLIPRIKKMLPSKRADETVDLLNKMSHTLSRYIGGQMIEILFVGTFTSIGFSLVGEKYALLLGIFAGMCNIIPYVGPYIGVLPALIVAIESGLTQVILVLVVTIVVQQVDGNFIYPNVIGRTLNIHPLTIIIILLVAGNIAGLFGMILGVPLYAVVKTIIEFIYNLVQLQHEQRTKSQSEQPK